jgi:hypothetical protein
MLVVYCCTCAFASPREHGLSLNNTALSAVACPALPYDKKVTSSDNDGHKHTHT